ncbi:MAG: hypothetical protein EB084_11075 [Proteobacteria bacterium]|nr:hypothetical protein [Pseudomonadota bacterium]
MSADSPATVPARPSPLRAIIVVLVFALLGAGVGVTVVVNQKPVYDSTATVYATPSTQGGLRAMADELTAGALTGGVMGSNLFYLMALLQSNACRLAVADSLHLDADDTFWGGADTPAADRDRDRLLRRLASAIVVTQKDSLIKVSVRTQSAELSQRIANACLDFLDARLTGDNSSKSATLSKQVSGVRVKLQKAEKALRDFMATRDFVPQEEREKAEITALLELHRQLALHEVELTGTQSQLDAPGDLNHQIELKALEAGTKARVDKLRKMVEEREAKLKALPDALLAYQRLVRDVKLNEKVLLVLSEQYNLALFQEAGRVVPYKVVDRPLVATMPTSRYGMLKVVLSMVLFGMFGWLVARLTSRQG